MTTEATVCGRVIIGGTNMTNSLSFEENGHDICVEAIDYSTDYDPKGQIRVYIDDQLEELLIHGKGQQRLMPVNMLTTSVIVT